MNNNLNTIKEALKKQGLSDLQITAKLLDLETRVQLELIDFFVKNLSVQQKDEVEKMVIAGRSPADITSYLGITKEEVEQRIKNISAKISQEVLNKNPTLEIQ